MQSDFSISDSLSILQKTMFSIVISERLETMDQITELLNCMKLLYTIANRYTKNPDDANDIVQDTCLCALKMLSKGKEIPQMKGYLIKTLKNIFLNSVLKNKRFSRIKDIYRKQQEEQANNNYRENTPEKCHEVSLLNDKYKKVIDMYYYDKMSIKEISILLNIREGTTKNRLYVARKKLKIYFLKIDEYKT
jgi:RNA polymerase sigma-70 factor (ECF subfamily)